MKLDAHEIVQRYEALESERENLDGQYDLIEKFVLPGKGRFFQEGHDEEESIDWTHRELYDGTAQNANVLLASHVHGSMTSPAETWFHFRFRDEDLNNDHEATRWLEACAEEVMASIQDSNFNLEVNEFYQDASGYGTAILLHDEQEGPALEWNGHRFSAEMLRSCYIEEGMDRQLTGIYFKRSYTPLQLAIRFGRENLPQRVQDKVDIVSGTDKNEDLIRCIYLDPDNNADTSTVLAPSQRPYRSAYVLVEGREVIGPEEGFYEMPGYVLRWQRTAGSKYGHGPGIIALGDILTLQEMVKMTRTGTEKTVDPPMKSTRKGILGDLDQRAGGLTVVREMSNLEPLLPPNSYRVENGWADVADLRERIRQFFFVDQLQLKESPQMTATEVRTRMELMQRTLGPTVGRIQDDFLDKMLQRSFWMMYRKGALPPIPEAVKTQAADLDIEYVGPLARSQKLSTVDGITRWLATLGEMVATNPQAADLLDVPNYDEIADYTAKVLGVPTKLTTSQQERDKARESRQKALAQAQATEQAQGLASAAKDASAAGVLPSPTTPNGGNGAPIPTA